jgi:hypothetical protein
MVMIEQGICQAMIIKLSGLPGGDFELSNGNPMTVYSAL